MLLLAELQREFSRAILTAEAPRLAFMPGPFSPQAGLQVYRNTVIGGAVNALRLTFPTIDRLVGEDFFDSMAAAFVETRPPTAPSLARYGDGFADFAKTYAPSLPYLRDVALLDLAIARTLVGSQARRRFVLDAVVSLELPQHLAILNLQYDAVALRDGVMAKDDVALAAIDLSAAPRRFLVWRRGRQAVVQAVSLATATFLSSLYAGDGADTALAQTFQQAGDDEALALLQSEIFAASFCNVISIGGTAT